MIRLGLLGAVALVSIFALEAGKASADEGSKCRLQQIASIPVIFRHNKPLVEVAINGQTALMLADTGSVRSLMFAKPAEALGLHSVVADGEFMGVGGARGAKAVTVAKFGFGGSVVSNLHLHAVDGGLGGEVAGVLGDDLLGQTDLEFDLAGGAIRLFDEKDCGHTNLAYWTKEPMVADLDSSGAEFQLDLQLNGRTVHATMDSGAGTSVVTSEAAARVGAKAQNVPTGAVGGLGSQEVEVTAMVFDTLKIGDEEIKKAKLLAGDYFRGNREAPIDSHIKRSTMDETEILLGADFLRAHRVFVSIRQKRMYFTYTGGPVFQVVAPVETAPTPK